ncbi:MAG: DUF1559 domain-containing protein [Planctomycetales bacterium]|nr:DUF1559 domain-containing protein [Planctomycetales bacterium]
MEASGIPVSGVSARYYCSYNKGDGIFSHGSGPQMLTTAFRSITDGLSNTLMNGEKTVFPSTSVPPGGASDGTNYSGWLSQWGSVSSVSHGINYPGRASYCTGIQYGSRHIGGAHFTLADGSVRFVSQNIAWSILSALGTKAGGDVVGEF